MSEKNEQSILTERLELAVERIRGIREDALGQVLGDPALEDYFAFCAAFLMMLHEHALFLQAGGLQSASIEELARRNRELYADILPEHYEESYGNPAYAVEKLGISRGRELCFLYTELRSLISFIYEGRLEEVVVRMELFLEVYSSFVYASSEGEGLPGGEDVRRMLYWFVSDYADLAAKRRIREQFCPEDCFGADMIRNSDLSDIRYLYGYGEYVSENELETARFLGQLSQETINLMADTYTEGYRIGFQVTGVDLSKKHSVSLHYQLGFERMMRRAIDNFAEMGLQPVVFRAASSVLDNKGMNKSGFYGGNANRQFDYDHKDDRALFLDKNYINRRLTAMRAAYEQYKREAGDYAGPAVVETFGEKEFLPVSKEAALQMSKEQNRLWVEYRSKSGELQREYIPEEETSYTIIAFPVPETGEVFRELFYETIRINTLDYMRYRRVQQTLIDVLDTADVCEIKGCGGNRTDLRINLYKLTDRKKETIFENCVADVNIPVGEVFTSPVLQGTNGVLHVSRVYLDGLEYRDLAITFEDGMIRDYSCGNFASEEENRKFIYENILFRHDTLPMGEFAIGTNTTAYVAARRLGVEAKLPILIAEKMGPHFAVGDTCYSHSEETRVYNPDGKEIVAKDNERSRLRGSRPEEAYFECHTDITIPYDELGELTAVRKDGSRVVIIQNGRFVLPGCEELNEAFDEEIIKL